MNEYTTKKRRHGMLGAALTAGVLLIVLLLNVGFTFLTEKNNLYIDMTKEKFFKVTNDMRAFLDPIDPKENNVTIYFLQERDFLTSMSMGYSNDYYKNAGYTESYYSGNTWGMGFVHNFAKVLEDEYEFIHVDYLDLEDDAEFIKNFKSTVGTTLGVQDVVIDNYTPVKNDDGSVRKDENGKDLYHHNFRICNRDSFFTFSQDTSYVFAFNGYYRFTATILSLSGATPIVYFTEGHGEEIGDAGNIDDFGKASALAKTFEDAGFYCRKIDVSTDYKKLLNDERARFVVVFDPASDFSGSDVSVLRKFVNEANHNLMVFEDPDTPDLPNFNEYLLDYWGVAFEDNVVYSKTGDDYAFIADYQKNEADVGASLTLSLTDLDSAPPIMVSNARTLKLSPNFVEKDGYYENAATKYTGTVLYTPASTEAHYKDGTVISYETDQQIGSEVTDPAPLVALAYETWMNSDNEYVPTYVFVSGSTDFASEKYLDDSSCGNKDVLFYASRLMGKENQPWDIDFVVCNTEGLDSITESDVTLWNVFLWGLIPAAIVVLGAVVFYKRRHL